MQVIFLERTEIPLQLGPTDEPLQVPTLPLQEGQVVLEGLAAGDLPVRDQVLVDVGHQPLQQLVQLRLVINADVLYTLQPPLAVQHGVVVPRSLLHVRFVQFPLQLALLLLLQVGVDVPSEAAGEVFQRLGLGKGTGLVVEPDRQWKIDLMDEGGEVLEVVAVGSDLRGLLIVLVVVLSHDDRGEGTAGFLAFVALEIVAVGVDLIEDGDGCDLGCIIVDELSGVPSVCIGQQLQHMPLGLQQALEVIHAQQHVPPLLAQRLRQVDHLHCQHVHPCLRVLLGVPVIEPPRPALLDGCFSLGERGRVEVEGQVLLVAAEVADDLVEG